MDDIKIKGHANLLKRNKSSVINTDDEAYLAAKKRAKNKDILEKLVIKTEELENKFDKIESLLDSILSNLNKINKGSL
jgi:DNA-binding transcriptional regulator YhcF (GntR family)